MAIACSPDYSSSLLLESFRVSMCPMTCWTGQWMQNSVQSKMTLSSLWQGPNGAGGSTQLAVLSHLTFRNIGILAFNISSI